MEEEMLMQRREEEGRGKERRKALLEKEERKWKEIEASLISSIPNAGNREAAAMAAAVRAVGGDSVLDDSFARERVSSIARRIRATQLARRALQVILLLSRFLSISSQFGMSIRCSTYDVTGNVDRLDLLVLSVSLTMNLQQLGGTVVRLILVFVSVARLASPLLC